MSRNSTLEHDAKHRSAQELEELYGIQFLQDPDSKLGPLYDPVSCKEYPSLLEWMAEQAQEEEWAEYDDLETFGRFDDDYF